jgi:hypothetical protein
MGYAVSKALGSSGNGMTGSVAEMVYAATDASSSTLVVTESVCEENKEPFRQVQFLLIRIEPFPHLVKGDTRNRMGRWRN